ncbi:G patch domain-containing protein 3-like isoform X2 [Oncorhynchus kisutch]|uniref:G patch domain-containing protein 3-like isoform X2 n=1 Tax=Oncorhynchus kisutch TaxID=8019 RepID=UPI0012DEC2A4|nr:G patch domain-containing protein 3-like isoform X2 [Oncorhynchus kisutch]
MSLMELAARVMKLKIKLQEPAKRRDFIQNTCLQGVRHKRDGVTWTPVTTSACGMRRGWRTGLEDKISQSATLRSSKGVGRQVMEKQGWKEGKGLGNSRAGIPEALENEGQHPKCKRDFGYHGEKLSSYFVKRPNQTCAYPRCMINPKT